MRPWTGGRFLTGSGTLLIAATLFLLAAGTASAATAVEVSAGGSHTCALLDSGGVECWGDNESGQLGDGTAATSSTPVAVFGLGNAIQVSAGGEHTCALLAGGTVECWGNNESGQLGDGTTTSIATPVAVSGLVNVTAISAGLAHTCALLAAGTVECWGNNESGQLGDGGTESHPAPVPVGGLGEVSAISAGWEHTCAIHTGAGEVECWGGDSGSQLGDGGTTDSPTPLTVPGVAAAGQLGAGDLYTCALLTTGAVECWGQLNPEGETTPPNPTLVVPGSEPGPTELSVGGFHACALLAGTVECWGDDTAGQLGDGEASAGLNQVPAPVTGLADAAQLSAGGEHTCALLTGGSVECWGQNEFGQLGDGGTESSPVPVRVAFPEPALEVPGPGGSGPPSTPGASAGRQSTVAASAAQTPVFGKTVSLSPVAGSVRVRLPGHRSFVPLGSVSNVPVGTIVDTAHGTVELSAATSTKGETQSGRFDGGVFRVTQKLSSSPFQPGRVGLTVLTLTGPPPSCASSRGAARASGRKRGGNHLWGEDDHGNFQTGGRYGSATVGGTKWLTAETCAGTLVKVARGKVSVTDKVRHRTVLVTAPGSYLALRPARAG